MDHFHCRTRTRIRIRTQIPVLCTYYRKGIWIWIWVSGNMFCMILYSHRVWNPNPSPNLNPSPRVEMSHKSQTKPRGTRLISEVMVPILTQFEIFVCIMSPPMAGSGCVPSLTNTDAEPGDGRRHLTPWRGPPVGVTPCRVRVPRSPGCRAASRRDASQCTAHTRGSTSPRRAERLCTTSCSRWGTATAAYWTVHWKQKHKTIRQRFNLKTLNKIRNRLHCA